MRFLLVILFPLSITGCACGIPHAAPGSLGTGAILGPPPVAAQNPMFVADRDHHRVWETMVNVMDDHFQTEREEPVRRIGGVLTEGRLSTFPKVGSTLFEPWHGDSAGSRELLESTLQSIRRQAEVKVTPDRGGYWIEVRVLKELEDVLRPTRATAGGATFRNDSSLTRVATPVGDQEVHDGWIPKGRDPALEQRLLNQLQSRFGIDSNRTTPNFATPMPCE